MNKPDLIRKIAEVTEMTRQDTSEFVDAFTEVVSEAMAAGEKVQLKGFGSFEVVERAEREGRNPQTGESLVIPARLSPKFKPSKTLKEYINE